MDKVDVDCASCGYEIKDFTHAASASCGHGLIHYNCSFFNNECPICEAKLTVSDSSPTFFRPNCFPQQEENLQLNLREINKSLNELKKLLIDQKQRYDELVQEMSQKIQAQDMMILQQQKQIYEMKLEKVEAMKQELQGKLNSLK